MEELGFSFDHFDEIFLVWSTTTRGYFGGYQLIVLYRRFTNLMLPGRGLRENSGEKKDFFSVRAVRMFKVVARCSKYDFWNPGQILHRHRCSDFF